MIDGCATDTAVDAGTGIEGFRLSPQQRHLWSFLEGSAAGPYRVSAEIRVEGELDPRALREALRDVVRRHEILRTSFRCLPGMTLPLQVISPSGEPRVFEQDLSGLGAEARMLALDRIREHLAGAAPDLDRGPLLDTVLVRLAPREHALLVALPALCADLESLGPLARAIGRSYSARVLGEAIEDEPAQYADVAEVFHHLLESEETAAGRAAWRELDPSALPSPRLPFQPADRAAAELAPRVLAVPLAPGLPRRLEELAARREGSVGSLLLAAWWALLHRLTGEDGLTVAVAHDGRSYEELEDAVGPMARCVPVRATLDASLSFGEAVTRVGEALEATAELQDFFTWERGEDGAPPRFPPVVFELRELPAPFPVARDLTFSPLAVRGWNERFLLLLRGLRTPGGLALELHFDRNAMPEEAVADLPERLGTLLDAALGSPEAPIRELPVVGPRERDRLVVAANATAADLGAVLCLHRLVREQAARTPERVAVVAGDGQLSYAELRERAGRLAARLARLGVGRGDRVAICLERGLGLAVGILGIHESGAAYLPLDPGYPALRLSSMLRAAGARALVSETRLRRRLPPFDGAVVYLDEEDAACGGGTAPEVPVTLEDLAYVIFTSGSTGRPKGVMVSHGAIANRLLWMQLQFPLTADDCVLQKTPFSFDASIWEIFSPLLAGARLVMARPGAHRDPSELVDAVLEQGVTTLQLVPSLLRAFLDEGRAGKCRSLRRLFCGGEALPVDQMERFLALSTAPLCNLYGPTEAAIDATFWQARPGLEQAVAPIGVPLANVRVYLLDEGLEPVPAGVPGELWIGGANLARGYLGQPGLTAERFLPDPLGRVAGARLYRTGDLARHRPDGALDILGRLDQQVKVRGFRIELGEIEASLGFHPGIADAVVVACQGKNGEAQLVAYAVPAAGAPPEDGLHRLPDGLRVAVINREEADLIYREIFEDGTYLRHGISLAAGDRVVDVGANIGLFTLFVHRRCPGARIYAFEPVPPVFETLERNVALHGVGASLFPVALADRTGEAEITYYPQWTGMSGLYADAREDEELTRAFLRNQDERLAEHADELLEGRFLGRAFRCPLTTLSDAIRENNLESIDLLKIDAEKAELDVLRGIVEEDWPRIGQIVIEAHDRGGNLQEVMALLTGHGFRVVADDSGLLRGTGMVNLYAVSLSWEEARNARPEVPEPPPPAPPTPAGPVTAAEVERWLGERLPDYMVPSAIVLLPELPRLPSGKVDRRELPEPERARPGSRPDAAAPATPTEELLAALWARVLGVERVGLRESFFELGGHSLLATQLVSRVREVFGVGMRVRTLFEHPTVAGFAGEVEAARAAGRGPSVPPVEPLPREAGRPLPLSFAQQRLWFLDRFDEGASVYNLPAGLRIRGGLRVAALERALTEVVRRHESLRTTFIAVDGAPAQAVAPPSPVVIPRVDLTGLPAERREREARRRAREEAGRSFDLSRGPLLRSTLLRLGAGDHALLFTMHHIVGDGWSTGVLVRELAELYGAFATGRAPALPELPVQYADFARWQRERLDGPVLEEQLAYWKGRLAGGPSPLELPTDRQRPAIQTFRGARRSFRVPADLAEELQALTRREGVTLFMALLAGFSALLHRYSGQEDFAVGTPVANRNRREIEDLIGVFINTVVLRVDLAGEPRFRGLLTRVRETALGAYAHEDLPFERLVNELQPERDLGRSPLFQVMLILQNAPMGAPELPGLEVELLPIESRIAKFDLTLEVAEAARGLSASFEYNTDLFDPDTVGRMAEHLLVLLAAAVADPERRVFELPLLPPEERRQVLLEWNATATEYPAERTIHELFAERAAERPDAVAVLRGEERLTYGELARRSALLAAHLRRLGVGPGVPVALSVERSPEMVVALLGILRAGGAYVPVDPDYPAPRRALMLEDSGAAAVLTQESLRGRFGGEAVPVVLLDADRAEIEAAGEEAPAPATADPDDLAYVIYTSGSTGRPKGVMVSHRNAVSFFTAMDHRLGTGPGCWLALTSISFDISVLELLWTLTRGFQVVVHEDPQDLLPSPGTAGEPAARTVDFSLFYFAAEQGKDAAAGPYRLLLEGARFADRHGFAAVWTPERHFHAFGGPYPNPVVTSAAVAAVTERVSVRAGSVVLPLHQPIRVAEEWAMVDNLSGGRAGISFASGWHADDFVLAPESYTARKEVMFEGIDTVRRLWRGEAVRARGGAGREVDVRILPRPVQPELPVWVTAAGSEETFRTAGEIGAGVLTHLLGQDLEDLAVKVAAYRRAWREAGHGPGDGHVALMLHAFVGEDQDSVLETVRRPFCNYLRTSLGLVQNLSRSLGREVDPRALSEADLDDLLERSFERYYDSAALLGTEESCLRLVERLKGVGVDEIACLIDFGIDEDRVLESLPRLDALRRRANPPADRTRRRNRRGHSVVEEVERHRVTHLQCTPTTARVLVGDARTRRALGRLDRLLLGGEALPPSLLEGLGEAWPVEVHNMYGPTETTVWSSTSPVPAGTARVSLGRPIANTRIYLVDRGLQPVPVGVPGELLVGGPGVTRGYLRRPGPTAERFVPDPFGPQPGARLYRTGDLARFRPGGEIAFLGRLDHQVKLHGFRIELEEIERALERHPGIERAVVVARGEGEGEARLAAFYVAPGAAEAGTGESRPGRYRLPNGMVVAHLGEWQAIQSYREIFQAETYLRHGIVLPDGACVFDVGANAGFFSLLVQSRCEAPRIHAVEPIPATFEALQANVETYGLNARLFNCGLSDREERATLTFYPAMSGLSGRYAADTTAQTRAILLEGLAAAGAPGADRVIGEAEIDELLEEQLRSETHVCPMRTLSSLIDAEGVESIDLLKVDVEGAEVDVLGGIREEHWGRIHQVVMEIDSRANLEAISSLLEARGYELTVDDFVVVEASARGPAVQVYMLYARRRGWSAPASQRMAAAVARPLAPAAAGDLSSGTLRELLAARLPSHMVPSLFVRVDALPLTPNGKVDRARLLVMDLAEAGRGRRHEPPRSAEEKALAAIWQRLLRVDRIGIHDNFFELGGDSILSIQMIAQAHQAGLHLTPRQLFRNQTIAALAAVVEAASEPQAEQGEVLGPVPLTPIQHWFFEQELPSPHHWNHAVLVETRADLDPGHLAAACERLVEHHDALRLRFHREAGSWRQENAPAGGPSPWARIDLSALPAPARSRARAEAAASVQGTLDLSRGPLLRAVLFGGGRVEPGRLLIAVHHLVIDGLSWRILLEDLQTAYRQLAAGSPVRLPAKTASFRRWAEHLVAAAGSPETRAELGHWLAAGRQAVPRLPVDHPGGANLEVGARTVTVRLDADETRVLLQAVPEAYRTGIEDVLLTALARGLAGWTGGRRLLVDLEGHGREPSSGSPDVSRTVGWFAAFAPVVLDPGPGDDLGEALMAVKEQLRAVPRRGLGYGLLRYLAPGDPAAAELRALPRPEVSFTYLGQLDQVLGDDVLFRPAGEPAGRARDPRQPRRYLLDVSGDVSGGRLRLLWTYPSERLAEETVQRLARACIEALRGLIEHCSRPEVGGRTPSDFPLAALEQADLDRILEGQPREVEDLLPLSPLQQGLLYHSLEEPETAVYLLQFRCTLVGELHPAAFEAAWQRVVDRHAILRSSFCWQGLDEPLQRVRRGVALRIGWQDWRRLPESERGQRLERFAEEDRSRPFDLSRPPLMRITVVRFGDREHRLVWSYHHLLLDAWSSATVVEEAFRLYTALREGGEPGLAPARPYRDYVSWLRRQDLREAESYWRKALAGFTEPTPLGLDRPAPPPAGSNREQAVATTRLTAAETEALRKMARGHRLTLNTLILGAWAYLLGYYGDEEDVVLGVVSSGREADLPGVGSMVGVFINTLPLRLRIAPAATLADWLERVQERQVEMRRFEHTPLVDVQRWSAVETGLPLFESIFVFENHPAGSGIARHRTGIEVRDFRSVARTTYPLSLVAAPGDELALELVHDLDRFDRATAGRVLGHLKTLLAAWPARAGERLAALSPLTEAERAELLRVPRPAPAPEEALCLHRLFERQAERAPDATAVRFEDRALSYGELERRANQLARHLIDLGAVPEDRVALLLHRSLDLVVAILGVLKAGAAYLPIEPDLPPERVRLLLEDAGVSLTVTRGALAAGAPAPGVAVVDLAAAAEPLARRQDMSPDPPLTPDNLAYVIYTSGSTGVPKGALITHRAVVRLFTSSRELFDFDEADVWSLFHSYAFDFSVWELWGALLRGGRVVVVPRDAARSPEDFHRLLAEERVTVLNQTPSAFRRLAEADEAAERPLPLRWVVFGGEALAPDSLAGWMARRGEERPRLVNMYGITETTVHVTFRLLARRDSEAAGRSPIGTALPDLQLFLLNRSIQPVPAGAAGELEVGGPGLARGYLGRPGLTAERFVPAPFGERPGERLYRSGDRARRLPEGGFEYLGRADQQVKIRGFRIEPGEIEAALRSHGGVRDALVLALEGPEDDRRLVAYVRPVAPVPTAGHLQELLRRRLPEYMVPSAFVFLENFPLNPNGKVDRRALPAPEGARPELGKRYVAPRNPVEELVAAAWAEALGLDRVGVRDDFLDLGGHSLLATRVISRIRERLEVDLPLRSLFESPTVEALSAVVQKALREGGGAGAPPLVRAARDGDLPLSFAQQRLWFLDRWQPGRALFNVPSVLELSGRLSVPVLRAAIREVVRRHESLRTSFPEHRGVPVQAISSPAAPAVPIIDLLRLPADDRRQEAERLAGEEARRPFDLARGALLRLGLLRLEEERHHLLLTLHHIVCDGRSMGVLVRETTELYRALGTGEPPRLPELPIQYADFALWQRSWLASGVLDRQLAYWRRRLVGAPTGPALPTDHPRPELETYRGGLLAISLPAETTERLKELSRRLGVTLFMTAVAAFQVLLRQVTGRDDVLVGTDVANRERLETESLIGFFVNQLPLRADLSGNPSVPELLRRVREVALGAYGHKDVPFEKLVEALRIERSLGHAPLFQVKVFFADPPDEEIDLPGLAVRRLGTEGGTAKLDLTLALQDTPRGLRGSLEYNLDLFETSTAGRWAARFQDLLAALAEHPEARLDELDRILEETERNQTVMATNRPGQPSFDPFKSIKPKAIHVGGGKVVERGRLAPGQDLPLVIEPAVADVDAAEWATAHREELEGDLRKHGAILFRGFGLDSTEGFERFALAVCSELFDENGEHPRESLSGNVYTPVYYPPDQKLLWHNENSFDLRWPMKILFGCARPADEGGETPIVDSRKVFEAIAPEVRQRFLERQVAYQRNFGVGVGLDWQAVFRTDDRAELERRAEQEDIEIVWKGPDRLRTRVRRPAAARHPVTGEWTWFNQAQHWHVSCLDPETRRSMESLFSSEDLPRHCYYGDGTPIADQDIAHVLSVYQRLEVSFPWQKGDVLLLDNMLVAHARNPFKGERRLLVALGDMGQYEEEATGGPNVG